MDSLEIEGKEYISAKRAAREHSYTMDYIGQLIRGGKLIGKKVGRAWYVEQESLNSYIALLSGSVEEKGEAIPREVDLESSEHESIDKVASATNKAEVSTEEEKIAPVQTVELEAARAETPIPVVAHTTTPKEPAPGYTAYHYPMLNYVQDTGREEEEILPTLSSVHKHAIAIRREEGEDVTDRSESGSNSYTAAQQQQAARHISAQKAPESSVGATVSYTPAKRLSLLPMTLGAAVAVLFFALVSVSVFFTRTLSYEGATAAVTESISYDSALGDSR